MTRNEAAERLRREHHDRYCEFAGGGMCFRLECAFLDSFDAAVEVLEGPEDVAQMLAESTTIEYARWLPWIREIEACGYRIVRPEAAEPGPAVHPEPDPVYWSGYQDGRAAERARR